MNWIRNQIKKWLGIDKLESLVRTANSIGVDVNYHEQTQIIIMSKINDGQIRIIPIYMKDIRTLEALVTEMKFRYNINNNPIFDTGPDRRF